MEVQATSPADTSQGKEAVDAEAANIAEQPILASSKGDLALAQVRPKPHEWNHLCVSWLSRDDPEGEPLFALEDAVEGGALELLRAISPAGGAVAANDTVRHGRRSARRRPGTRPLFSCGVVLF